MALEVWKDSQQLGGFILCVVTIPMCCLATGLRFAASKKTTGKVNLESWLALASLVFFLVYTLMFLYLLTVLNGQSLTELAMGPPETIVHVLKVGWAMSPQFCPNQLLTKLTLLLFYHRIFWINKRFVRWLWCIGVLTVLWTISVYLVKWMLCWPVAYTWDKTLSGGKCIEIPAFLAASETINSVIDFVMIAMAIRIVATLQMSFSEKFRLSILFSVGSLSGIVGFIKIAEAYSAAYTSILDPIWDITQMATSIMCCCAPSFPSLFAGLEMPKPLSSLFSSLRSSKGRSAVSTDQSKSGSWVPMSASQPNLAWTQVSAVHQNDGRPSDGRPSDGYGFDTGSYHRVSDQTVNPSYPMKVVEVRQDVEFV
ncbi:hypothetical protein J7T55_010612 [Diaporthe amygdali]|uniref:uncharacterized protein n=1 Tax=Phomopsis amygdali TaxID=1214568 RepID=UPI0022FDEF71|nr:uncharacterized protein J7T55_010612 [Diaporthe amygdali]KAJ0115789.1 hypothetical protein J7T55_010612 [Diaporthe amygdali]